MKAVIISGGQPVKRQRALHHLEKSDLIICADKGAEYAASYGVAPDLIVGDMDSIDSRRLSEFHESKILMSPKEKDFTDTHLAVMKALEKGADEITLICATGLRSDHAMANIRLLLYIYEAGAKGKIVDDENTITLCTGKSVFNSKEGTTISILALSDKTEGIRLKGFKYPLKNKKVGLNWTMGISNEIISGHAVISVKKGKLLIFEIHN